MIGYVNSLLWDSYLERYWHESEVEALFTDYVRWCERHSLQPEVDDWEMVDGSNISHIAYHALLYREQQDGK